MARNSAQDARLEEDRRKRRFTFSLSIYLPLSDTRTCTCVRTWLPTYLRVRTPGGPSVHVLISRTWMIWLFGRHVQNHHHTIDHHVIDHSSSLSVWLSRVLTLETHFLVAARASCPCMLGTSIPTCQYLPHVMPTSIPTGNSTILTHIHHT